MHAAVQGHSLIVSLALPRLYYKEWVHDDVTLHKSCLRLRTEQVQMVEAPHILNCIDSRQYNTLCISQSCDVFLSRIHTKQRAHLPRYQISS